MILAIVFAHVWGVIQLIVLGSLARTVRMRTVLAAMAVGLYAIGPLTVFLQLGWIHLAASLLGTPVAHMQSIASYTVDPFLEEALKLLPLAMLLLLIPAIRRQWSVTDCVLIAAATGSGYGLAENLYRYAGSPDAAQAIAGGWAISIGSVTLLVPGVVRTLTSWLPAGTVFVDETIRVNSHLVWSAIGGLAVGLIIRNRTRAARVVAGGLLLYIGLDHAAGNAALSSGTWLSPFTTPLHSLATLGGLMVIVALAAAWWLDRPVQPTGAALEPLLAAERSAASRIAGTLKAAMSRLPWSIPWVGGFARARRAYHAAHASAPADPDGLLAAIVAQRDRIDRELTQTESPRLLPSGLAPSALRSALRRPAVIMSLVFLTPSILFLVIGGFPQTAGLQRVMSGPVLWPVVLLITVATQARLAWSVIVGVRNWSRTRRLPMGDDAAIVGLQLACGVGAVGLAGFTMMRVLGGVSAGSRLLSSAHGADAANRLTPNIAFPLVNGPGAVAPNPPGQKLPGEAAEPNTKAPSDAGSEAPPPPPPQPSAKPKPQPHPAPPKPTPEEIAAKNAAKEAAKAEALATQAEADAVEAREFHTKALEAWDAAERDRNSGTDPELDAARERTRKAVEAAEAADPADRDMLQAEAEAAKAAQQKVVEDRWARTSAEEEEAKNAAGIAEKGMNEANAKAAEAREAAGNAHYAAARAADPLGSAADDADKNYAAAQAKEWDAFQDPNSDYPAAQKAAALAREQAEAARAAANAAKDFRSASVIGVDKP